MNIIGRHISHHTKQEIGKRHRSTLPFAYQSLAIFTNLQLPIFLLTLSTFAAFGQIQTLHATAFENNFANHFKPTSNNNLTPNLPTHTKNNLPHLNQYQKDIQKQQRQQQELEAIYREISQPTRSTNSTTINYDLPSCASIQGASAYRSAFAEISKMADGQKTFTLKEANFLVENTFYENQAQFEQFDTVIEQIGQFLTWKMDELNYDQNSNLAKNLILYRFFSDTLEI